MKLAKYSIARTDERRTSNLILAKTILSRVPLYFTVFCDGNSSKRNIYGGGEDGFGNGVRAALPNFLFLVAVLYRRDVEAWTRLALMHSLFFLVKGIAAALTVVPDARGYTPLLIA